MHIKRIIILVTFLLVLIYPSFGQAAKSETELSSLAKIDIGLQGIGFTYEPKISNKIIIDLSAGAGGGYDISERSITYYVLKPAFYLSLTPKYFYNIQARIKKGKNTQFNAGNYIGVRLKYVTPLDGKTDAIRNSILTNIHWGMQRGIGNHWLFNAHIGVGYAEDIDYHYGTIYPSLDFIFSYIILNPKS